MSSPARAPGDGWGQALPEIVIAAVVVAVAAVAGYAAAGAAGTAVVVVVATVAGLAVLRGLVPQARGAHDDDPPPDLEAVPATFTGYWRKRAGLADGTRSGAAYDAELRGTLQHLLAARLAEHHGVSLRDDPAAARRLLCPRPDDERLWHWVDPARPPATAAGTPGIPPRTLARLIDRLERLGD